MNSFGSDTQMDVIQECDEPVVKKICLDELVQIDIIHDPKSWNKFDVGESNSNCERKIWERLADANTNGHNISHELTRVWMRGSNGLIDGCQIKKCSAASIELNSDIVMNTHVRTLTHTHIC